MSGETASLHKRRVLVTRPAAQAEGLCRLLEARGAQVIRLPLQAIEAVRQPAVAARQLHEARSASAWIFTSVNAVNYAAQLDAGLWPAVIAVGAATAVALESLGHVPQLPSQDYSSEGVLAMPQLQAVAGRRYLIVTGEKSRELMATTLRGRGAAVEVVAVYRRVLLPHAAESVARALRGCDAIVLTSGEALTHLLTLTDAAQRPLLLRARLVVPSQRVVEQARQLGFTGSVLVPRQIADADYVRCLEEAVGSTANS